MVYFLHCNDRSKLGGESEHYRIQVSRPPISDTPPLTPSQQLFCLEQNSNIRAITPVYDLPEKFTVGPKVIELTQDHNSSLCCVLKELSKYLIEFH